MSSRKNSQIYVARFSRSTNEDDLSEHFKEFGKIKDISVKNGYAFIVILFSLFGVIFCEIFKTSGHFIFFCELSKIIC